MAKEHEYCCCAIPLLNVGIYLTILEQLTAGILVGTLAIATPSIVGASNPSFAPWLVAVTAYIVCGAQAMGFIGVFKEKAGLFQRYTHINAFAVSAVFGVTATWIIVSATQHQKAEDRCISTFFPPANAATGVAASTLSAQGDTICNIFAWADVGIMGGLWVVMAIFQGYLIMITRWYSRSQQDDHSKYYSIYSVTPPEGIEIGERRQDDAWDPRPSTDSWSGTGAQAARPAYAEHGRHASDATEKGYGVRADAYNVPANYEYPGAAGGSYIDKPSLEPYHPSPVHTEEVSPTPTAYSHPVDHNYGKDAAIQNPQGAMYPHNNSTGYAQSTAQASYYNDPPQYSGAKQY